MHSKYSTYSVGLRLHTPQLWNYRSGLCGVLCDKFFIMGKAVKISYYDWSLSWLTPLMFKGAKRPLKKKDLYALTGLTATSKTLPNMPKAMPLTFWILKYLRIHILTILKCWIMHLRRQLVLQRI